MSWFTTLSGGISKDIRVKLLGFYPRQPVADLQNTLSLKLACESVTNNRQAKASLTLCFFKQLLNA
ncbi:MAG: hypothetical protein HEQ35_19050 [Gloeotrichia echinulata IR180]|nr:hypothetical protein [Gloeotrichia echinulata DEX184]